jgi:hypothetical protein
VLLVRAPITLEVAKVATMVTRVVIKVVTVAKAVGPRKEMAMPPSNSSEFCR